MKKNLLVVVLFLLTASVAWTQPLFLTGEDDLQRTTDQLKGDIKEISQRYSNRLGWTELHFHTVTTYKDNQIVRTLTTGDFGDSRTEHFYRADGKLDRKETKNLSKDTGAETDATLVTYHYHAKGVTAKYEKREKMLNLSKEERYYDPHGRLVAYKKYNSKEELSMAVEHNYVSNTAEKKLLSTSKTNYFKGEVTDSKQLSYHSEPFSINGEECTKIRIENLVTSKKSPEPKKEIYHEYVKADGTVLRNSQYLLGAPIMYEWVYEYDERGNWISKAEFRKRDRTLQTYYSRKITYTDGYVSGSDEYDVKTVWNKKFAPSEEQFYFRRLLESGRFKTYDRYQRNISKSIKFLGDLNSNSAFIHHLEQKKIIELIDYRLVADEFLHEAQALVSDADDYLVKSSAGMFFAFNDHKQLLEFQKDAITNEIGVIFNPENGNTYKYLWRTSPKAEILPLEKLPPAPKNTYWVKIHNEKGQEMVIVVESGKLIDHSNVKLDRLGASDYVMVRGEQVLLMKNGSQAKLGSIQPAAFISKEALTKLYAQHQPKTTPQATAQPSSSTPPKPVAKEADRSNFGCYNDVACLKRRAVQVFQKAKQAGQSDQSAYQQMGQVLEQVYQNKKSLAFDMMMVVDQKYLSGLQKAISPEIRQYIRQKSQEAVDRYTQKHGKPKIKTVPYKPKNR